jgi:Fe-S cluster biogenesis protein NfuA
MSIIQKIEVVLEKVQPFIISHGGRIIFVRFEDGIVFVRLEGACVNCPASMYTVNIGLKRALQEEINEVIDVEIVEDE